MSAQFNGYKTRNDMITAFICNALETAVAFFAFVFITIVLTGFGLGFVYLLIGGLLNIFGVFVPGISVR